MSKIRLTIKESKLKIFVAFEALVKEKNQIKILVKPE